MLMELIWVYLRLEHYPIQWSIFPPEDTPRLTSWDADSALIMVGLGQVPENLGFRFSRKALTASRWSWVRPAMSWWAASYSRASGSSRFVTLFTTLLESPSALVGPEASCSASSSTVLSSSPAGTTLWTRPMVAASFALTVRPVMISSSARPGPISRVRK